MQRTDPCLWVVPIEPLEERYSANWLRWTQKWLQKADMRYLVILPHDNDQKYDKIKNGQFLDVIGTNRFKAAQLEIIMRLFTEGRVQDNDIFWFHDMWFPGIEMLAYIRDAAGIKFKIFGLLHAGTYDPHDFLAQKGMQRWATDLEYSWLKLVDGVFVATQFHKNMINQSRHVRNLLNKIHVTGFPIYWEDSDKQTHKENIVVFPHRLAPEKGIDQWKKFVGLAGHLGLTDTWQFIRTKDVCQTKAEYYELLRKAKYAVSFARQETWGIAMQEAVLEGCLPLVPDRLSYTEMYPEIFKFGAHGGTHSAMRLFMRLEACDSEKLVAAHHFLHSKIRKDGNAAFDNMLDIMLHGRCYGI